MPVIREWIDQKADVVVVTLWRQDIHSEPDVCIFSFCKMYIIVSDIFSSSAGPIKPYQCNEQDYQGSKILLLQQYNLNVLEVLSIWTGFLTHDKTEITLQTPIFSSSFFIFSLRSLSSQDRWSLKTSSCLSFKVKFKIWCCIFIKVLVVAMFAPGRHVSRGSLSRH